MNFDGYDSLCYVEVSDIHNAPTIELPKHEWISVKDRLPDEDSWVLCLLKQPKAYGGQIQVCKFKEADKWSKEPYFDHYRNGFPDVTHWMTLPEPPERNDM